MPNILEQFVSCYNAGVRTGDFGDLLALLTEDAVLEFEGTPDYGPFTGKQAIAQRFLDDRPDDEIMVDDVQCDAGRCTAAFRWCDIPESRGGDIMLREREGRIVRLTFAFGGAR